MSQQFQKTIEDFTCQHCGHDVTGNGYTNHCPACLWSKHVDVHPGDRASTCGGMMEPVELTIHEKKYIIKHKCTVCGFEKNNASVEGDNTDAIIALSAKRL